MEHLTAGEWAAREFGGAMLGHGARKKRLVEIATRMKEQPQVSIPKASPSWASTRATYRFASNPEVSHAGVMAGPVAATVERIRRQKRVLVIQDTTHLSFGGARASESLGPVGAGDTSRGFLAHTALAVGDGRAPLGVLAQEVWARTGPAKPKKESVSERKKRARESEKWGKVATQVEDAIASLGAARPAIVQVFDAEGDAFEVFESLRELGHGFVIRAGHERLLDPEEDDPDYLSASAASAPIHGHVELDVPARPGRAARVARLTVRAKSVCIRPPKNRGRVGNPIDLNIVHLVESAPSPDVEPISWVLFTTEPADTFDDCVSVVSDYASRWLIEEFHMALKTGCAMEDRQLQTFEALSVLLAIVNPIAVSLLGLRHLARAAPDAPAEEWLTPMQLKALRILRPKLPPNPSVREAIRTIASVGGFLGRKGDGEPGWRTIWSGFRDVLLISDAFEAAAKSG